MRVLTVAALFLAMSAAASGQAGSPRTSQDPASPLEKNQDSASQLGTSPAKPSDNGQADVAVPQIPSDVSPLPAWVTYRFFFLHVANLDKVAAQEEANGKEGEKWRTHDQRVARLSEEEGKIVRQEAHDCNQEVSDMDAKIQAEASVFRTQYPTGRDRDILLPPELEYRWQQRIQIINSHIDQLRLMLGEDSFQKLDSYVHRDFEPVVMTVPDTPVPPAKDKPLGDIQ
ncbi:MAG TPA: hypothetical protein VFF39_17580 [Verrucomicrobiae bacterium]|jgi:hypothetical protein|nr:hypothetical protein [Verrucomicrobiae bacterium]